MKKISIKDKIKGGKYDGKRISDLVNEKGVIFSLIKEGYDFDDEVLSQAHIRRTIRDEHFEIRVRDTDSICENTKLKKDNVSVKKILSEINTIERYGAKYDEDDDTEN